MKENQKLAYNVSIRNFENKRRLSNILLKIQTLRHFLASDFFNWFFRSYALNFEISNLHIILPVFDCLSF